MKTAASKMESWIGRTVVLEGTFPIPMPNGQVAYSPVKARLVAVFDDAFEVMEDGDGESTIYLRTNLRSIHPVSIAQVRSKLIT